MFFFVTSTPPPHSLARGYIGVPHEDVPPGIQVLECGINECAGVAGTVPYIAHVYGGAGAPVQGGNNLWESRGVRGLGVLDVIQLLDQPSRPRGIDHTRIMLPVQATVVQMHTRAYIPADIVTDHIVSPAPNKVASHGVLTEVVLDRVAALLVGPVYY